MSDSVPCSFRSLIDRHFAGRIAPRDETRLREHLPGCDGCRSYYDRHLVLAGVDPEIPGAHERLARGLGIRTRRPALITWLAPIAAAAAVALLLVVLLPVPGPDRGGLVARGGDFDGNHVAAPARLHIYRLEAGGGSAHVGEEIRAGDELAFAYENRAGKQRLLVFGVDEERHVYWYHPPWRDPKENPVAVPIEPGPHLHELPEAVTHDLEGQTLRIYAVFIDEPLSVREVERALRDHADRPTDLTFPGAHTTSKQVRVNH